tara:strand:- start:1537 stop:2043 length:507 start_codon:yes stop_codon:yes gene_type:complete
MKKLILITVLLMSVLSYGQITMNVSQDARLLFLGDDKGNDAGTMDITIRSEWHYWANDYVSYFVAPEYEYAELTTPYRRYSVNFGATYKLPIDKLEGTISIGHGIIDHYKGYMGFGGNFQLSYEVLEGFKLFLDAEIVDRKDLTIWGETTLADRITVSGKFGVKYKLN